MTGPIGDKLLQDESAQSVMERSHTESPRSTAFGSDAGILGLQRAAGNRAVSQLLRSRRRTVAHRAVQSFEEQLLRTTPSSPREMIPPEVSHLMEDNWPEIPVHIHRGGAAGRLLAEAGTVAAAVGPHIVLSPRAPALQSIEGRHILAHELTHVAQQRGSMPKPLGSLVGRDVAETKAVHAADQITSGVAPAPMSPAPMIHYVGGDLAAGIQIPRAHSPMGTAERPKRTVGNRGKPAGKS